MVFGNPIYLFYNYVNLFCLFFVNSIKRCKNKKKLYFTNYW